MPVRLAPPILRVEDVDGGVVVVIEEVNLKARPSERRFGAMLALAAVIALVSTGALVPSAARGSVSPLTDPAKIQKLAARAYAWGLAPEFVYRFENYNDLVTAPRNTLGGSRRRRRGTTKPRTPATHRCFTSTR